MAASDDPTVRQLLQERLHALEEDVLHKMRTLRASGAAADHKVDDDVAATPGDDVGLAVVEMQARTAERIRRALARLEEGDYGVCDDCGAAIGQARLRVVPFASRCTACQEALERR